MADLNGNPFLLDEETKEPIPNEYNPPPPAELNQAEDSPVSEVPMDLEHGIDFGALDWAHGALPSTGQVDPSTMPQLISG